MICLRMRGSSVSACHCSMPKYGVQTDKVELVPLIMILQSAYFCINNSSEYHTQLLKNLFRPCLAQSEPKHCILNA